MARDINNADFKAADKALQAMLFSKARRTKILTNVRKRTLRQSQSNIRRQKAPDGTKWQSRKDGSEKMLKNLLKAKSLRYYNDGFQMVITYKNKLTGQIAARHQEGLTETVTAEQHKKRMPKPDYDKPATAAQARALREVGFTIVRASGRGRQQPSNRWIKKNLTIGQAGAIYRTMSNTKPKSQWKIKNPPRPFLGLTDKQAENILVSEILKEASDGAR